MSLKIFSTTVSCGKLCVNIAMFECTIEQKIVATKRLSDFLNYQNKVFFLKVRELLI